MKYWRLKDSDRVIRTGNITMNPDRWEEITREEYEAKKLSNRDILL